MTLALPRTFANEYAGKGLVEMFRVMDQSLPAAVNSGIVGNDAHRSGYHRSRNWLLNNGKASDYSILAGKDKIGPGWACSALDVSLSAAEMKLRTQRMIDAAKAKDPRLAALREFIGTVNGRDVCGWNFVATGTGSRSTVGLHETKFGDTSHLWHMHFSVLRQFADDVEACKVVGAVFAGLPLPPVVVPKIVINGVEYDDLTSVSAAGINSSRDTGDFSRHVYYAQHWLVATGRPGPENGYWEPETQQAFNAFRRSLGWAGPDVLGAVGLTSLSALATKAGSTKPVRL